MHSLYSKIAHIDFLQQNPLLERLFEEQYHVATDFLHPLFE